ncbi:Hypothetical Protein FCC1311_031152 [Hondaea fermentalgiana]|uniref:Uncharacterized protein n=1 Tax=Hondaea fermentalgiana TaxID=2315210 RepID=A0A2R5GE35_9STRA|nr:Hypothetical Protein FCC1311_031152 [Hondaea fermentalgiana]|eukprot:GBG26893.1 Hypothetical Protein FCC1311_031152 [Hondaea fermentalgiana]
MQKTTPAVAAPAMNAGCRRYAIHSSGISTLKRSLVPVPVPAPPALAGLRNEARGMHTELLVQDNCAVVLGETPHRCDTDPKVKTIRDEPSSDYSRFACRGCTCSVAPSREKPPSQMVWYGMVWYS